MSRSAIAPGAGDTARSLRTAGLLCAIGGGIMAIGGVVTAMISSSVPATSVSYPLTPAAFRITEVTWAICHVLLFLGTLGFARANAVGPGLLGRIGLGLALVGMALIVPCQLGFALYATATTDSTPGMILSTTIGLATMVAALGFLLAGIAVLRARHWQGWRRYTPLLCGLVALVGLVPVLAIVPDLFFWLLAAWYASFVPFGLALYQQRSVTGPTTLTVAPA
jgi:hypothetical protein